MQGIKLVMTTVSYIDNSESPTKVRKLHWEVQSSKFLNARLWSSFYNDQQSLGDTLVTDEKVLKMLNMKSLKVRNQL